MALLKRLVSGFRALFRRTQAEQDLDAELRDFLDTAIEQKMRSGMSREKAVRAARLELGGVEVVKDRVRDVSWDALAGSCWQDVRYAVRTLRKAPGFTLVAVLTLTLGIGANTAIFSVVNSLLLRMLPVVEPQRLVTLSEGPAPNQQQWTSATWNEIRKHAPLFDGVFAWSGPGPLNVAQGGESQSVDGLFASGDFFSMLGVPALVGRTFAAADDVRGGGPDGPVAVISHGFWQDRFGGAADVVGTPLVIERVSFTIVGVTPPGFFGVEVGRAFDVAMPLGTEPLVRARGTALDAPSTRWLRVMLRLKPGQALDDATVTLRDRQPMIREGAMPQDFPQFRDEFLKSPFTLVPAAAGGSSLRDRYERPLLMIFVLVALVLVVACANLANLLLARGTSRRHELTVRLALGAPRARLVRQLLIESLIISAIGALAGLVFAGWGSRAIVAQLAPASGPRILLELSLDWRVLGFTGAMAVATAMLFGTVPALRTTRVVPIDALKTGRRLTRGEAGVNVSSALLVAQMALSLMLVVAAGLLVRTFERLATLPLGFDRDGVLLVSVDATRVPIDPANRSAFYHRLVGAALAVPGVAHAAGSMQTPVTGGGFLSMHVDVPGALPTAERASLVNFITPGWFATYGTAIRAGRDVDEHDTKTAPPVALVNEAFVRRYFPGRNAMNGTVAVSLGGRGEVPIGTRAVVGVVEDAVYRTLREEVLPTMYMPLAQWPDVGIPLIPRVSIGVRKSMDSTMPPASDVAAALTAVDRNLNLSFRPLADHVNASFSQERLVAMLAGFFGLLALLLAGLGLYGVTAYGVTRRRMEIGIRMALGAQQSDVVALVLGRTIIVTALGIVLGLGGAAAVTRYLGAMLFGLTPLDPFTFTAVSLMFVAVSTLAAFIPARRATRVDPLTALRCE